MAVGSLTILYTVKPRNKQAWKSVPDLDSDKGLRISEGLYSLVFAQ
jgi:hypothetical protein